MITYTMQMDEKFERTLKELAQGGSVADVIQRAIVTYKYLKTNTPTGSSNQVSITDSNGVVQQVVELP